MKCFSGEPGKKKAPRHHVREAVLCTEIALDWIGLHWQALSVQCFQAAASLAALAGSACLAGLSVSCFDSLTDTYHPAFASLR